MSLIKLYKKLKVIKDTKLQKVPVVTQSSLSITGNVIDLNINGIASNILIGYSGTVKFKSKMPIGCKVKVGNTSILIINLFRIELPSIIFEYFGNLKIHNCTVMNFDGSKIKSSISNFDNELLLDKSKTNLEDDTLILYDIPKQKLEKPFSKGLIPNVINTSYMDKRGKLQKYGKKEIQDIATTIQKFINPNEGINVSNLKKSSISQPAISEPIVSKPSVSKPTTSKPGVSKPGVFKPGASKPTVSKPTVSKPTISSPKIEETGGKY